MRAAATLACVARINSITSGLRLFGMIELPVVYCAGNATNANSPLVNSDTSQAMRRRSSVALPSASSAASSYLPRESWA